MFCKKSYSTFWYIIFLFYVFSAVGICEVVIQNPSFETGDYRPEWKGVYNTDIWLMDDNANQWWEPYAISDISDDGKATDGDWYIMWEDDGIYQIAEQNIEEHVIYKISFDACQSWNAVAVVLDLGYEVANNDYVVEASETYYPVRRLEEVPGRGLLYVGTWERFSLDYIPTANAVGEPFYIKIGNEDIGEWLAIDNVQLKGYKDYAWPISPPDGATDVPIETDLQWSVEAGYTCDVYFGTNGEPNFLMNPKVVSDSSVTSYTPPEPLEYETKYYWRVDPIDPNDGIPLTHTGPIYSFTTISLTPVITADPKSQTGDIVTLTVGAAGVGDLIYKWYKVGEPDTLYATTIEPSLAIDFSTAPISDEGNYYCTVTNDYGTSDPSESARVMKPRLVGWWKFDGDLTDSVTEEVSGAPTHDGTGSTDGYAGGVDDGDAAQFDGLGKIVTISDSGEYFNFYSQGMTVSTWVNCALDGSWDGVIGKQSNGDDWWVVGWMIGINDAWSPHSTHFSVRNPWWDLYANPDSGEINDGQWHLITGVFEPDYSDRTCLMQVYVDGALRNTSDILEMSAVLKSDYELVIGNVRTHNEEEDETFGGDGSFHGLVDDVKIYNYALEAMDIAMMYIDKNPGSSVCVDQNEPWRQFDVVGEPGESSWCRVDIEDFAEFASVWMNCNLYRECLE